jgi:hypothetical protein
MRLSEWCSALLMFWSTWTPLQMIAALLWGFSAKFPNNVSHFVTIRHGSPLELYFLAELVKAIERMVPYIVDATNDPDQGVRFYALIALSEISGQGR